MKFRIFNTVFKSFEDTSDMAVANDGRIITWNGEYLNEKWDCLNGGWKTNPYRISWGMGAQDKNGKDIYEGDIVKVLDNLFQVKFGKIRREVIGYDDKPRFLEFNTFYFESLVDKRPYFSIVTHEQNDLDITEVVGNIYENPDKL